jgi:hypothetical protein
MAVPDLVNPVALIEDAKCFARVPQHRWPKSVHCPTYGSGTAIRDGVGSTCPKAVTNETHRSGSFFAANTRDLSSPKPFKGTTLVSYLPGI